jgi:hypothetical protein
MRRSGGSIVACTLPLVASLGGETGGLGELAESENIKGYGELGSGARLVDDFVARKCR